VRTIAKRREPLSLTEHRSRPGATYANYRHNAELIAALVEEQRGLCCYCLSRIRADDGSARVEHWHCQRHYSDEDLDYSNLLAVCRGNAGQRVFNIAMGANGIGHYLATPRMLPTTWKPS
jgi:uncharacterized protein (TIGR02646 family)